MKLAGKVAIITGGGRGIGRAIAFALASEGARVVVVARTSSDIEGVAREIESRGGEAIAIHADVSSEDDVAGMMSQTLDRFQHVDILVNNAAITIPYRPLVDLTLQEWNSVLAVNLTGAFLCAREVLPKMIEQGYGKIINISSSGARQGSAGRSPYRPSKAALINFTECLAAEVRQYGIDVKGLCPGMTDTGLIKKIRQDTVSDRVMRPEEIASVVLFLASDESSAITGTVIDAFGPSNTLFGARPPHPKIE
jgi:3-oxoacyl-[acyl-carrier protein] reductase